jgi:hypothetical protein
MAVGERALRLHADYQLNGRATPHLREIPQVLIESFTRESSAGIYPRLNNISEEKATRMSHSMNRKLQMRKASILPKSIVY